MDGIAYYLYKTVLHDWHAHGICLPGLGQRPSIGTGRLAHELFKAPREMKFIAKTQ
jgi:hypothetical protein